MACPAWNFIYSAVDEKPEVVVNSLKKMAEASGLACPERSRGEPPTSWSRTRFPALLKSIDSYSPRLLSVESDGQYLLNAVEFYCFWGNPRLQNYLHQKFIRQTPVAQPQRHVFSERQDAGPRAQWNQRSVGGLARSLLERFCRPGRPFLRQSKAGWRSAVWSVPVREDSAFCITGK